MSFVKGIVVKSVAPTSTDDVTKGYYKGFRWIVSNVSYECMNASAGSADWSSGSSRGATWGTPLTPSTLSGNVDNYAPTGWGSDKSHLRIDCGGSDREMTGLDSTGFQDGQSIIITNISNKVLKIQENDGSSSAANRFLIKGELKIEENESMMFIFDAISIRWRATTIH